MTQKWSLSDRIQSQRHRSKAGVALGGVSIVAACLALHWCLEVGTAAADPPRPVPAQARASVAAGQTPAPSPGKTAAAPLKIVANVNGEDVTREQLAGECLMHYGEDVLDRMVNKYLIIEECKKRGITVSQAEVNLEIERMAGRFGLPTDQWLKMLSQERGISRAQYASDIVWPTLALRKLAGAQLTILDSEIQQEYETLYGPAVKARLIVCSELEKAKKVRAEAAADPGQFGTIAMHNSEDVSASLKGLIQPIQKHVGDENIEQAAFTMQDGEVSQVISVANQYVILKREELLPARNVPMTDQLRAGLEEIIRDRKTRDVASDVFRALQKDVPVQVVYTDEAKRAQMPNVAAIVGEKQLSTGELAEACLDRHAQEVLEGMINRRLLEQACKKKNITITRADMDKEIARAAAMSCPAKPDGSPDIAAWLKLVTEEQGISEEIYRRDSVWPTVALKKLVGEKVEITEEDLQKGFEANYGPRVRCLAIVMDNLRRAQQVWEMARKNPSEEAFGNLAAQYSIEGSSRALRGEVPPIQKHGGQPMLEKEAFSLQPGELSGIVQVDGSRFVILFCVGRTDPVQVDMASVRKLIYEDIHEKKLRITMASYFQQLQQNATIDNYLAGTSQSPSKPRVTTRPASGAVKAQ